jgi:hypothetical protein
MTLDEITQAAKIAGILKDENVEPMPQTFDPALRKFVPSLSDQGSKRVVLYGPDGQPISTVEGKLAVRAEEIETAISTLQTALAGAGVDAKTLADVVTALDGKSTEAKQDAANTLLTALKGKDYATQTTLAQVLAKMIAAPATEAKQDAANTLLTALKGKDYATQTTLAQVLAKMIAAPATEAKQDAANTLLTALKGKDYATQTTLAQVLAKMIAAPATEAKQDAANTLLTALKGKDYATQTTLAQVLAKMIAAPATEAKQDAANTLLTALKGKDYATQTTLAQVLAKMIAAPATEAKQDALAEKIDGILDGTTPATTQLTGSNVAYDSTHDAIKTVNASLLHESFDFKNTKEVTVSPGSYLVDTFRPTNGYAMLRIITKRIGAAHNWRLCANWSSDGTQVYQVVEKLHTATSGDADTQTAKIVTPVGSQWVMLQLFNDDAENSHSYHVHMMLTAG